MKQCKLLFRGLTVLAFLTAALSVNAQTGIYNPVSLSIDRVDGKYSAGDTVRVYATLTEPVSDSLLFKVKCNDRKIGKEAPLSLKVGEKTLIYTASFDKPSAVQVEISPNVHFKPEAMIGFIFDAEKFTPGFEEPADFVKFWDRQISTLRKSKAKPVLTPVELPSELAGYSDRVDAYALEINMPEGRPSRSYLAIPKNCAAKSSAIMIFPHAAGYSPSNLKNAVQWAAKGAIVIDINAHGYEDGQPKSYYDGFAKGELKDYRTRKVVDHESFYFRLMYLRLVRAMDYAVKLRQWDGKRVVVMGSSQGGGQTAALAGLDSRVSLAVITVPALTDMGGSLAKHSCGWPYKRVMRSGGDDGSNSILPYYDGANFLRHTKARLIMEAGLIDRTCPPECVFSAFNVAASEDKMIMTFPYRPHTTMNIVKDKKKEWKKTVDGRRIELVEEYIR